MNENIVVIKPNQEITLALEDEYQLILTSLMEDEESEYICRAFIQDETEHGIVLPVEIKDNNLCFVLPEQLCIFNPSKNYILKIELVLETQLLTPVLVTCTIDLNDLLEAEEEQSESEDNAEAEQPIKAFKSEDDADIEAAIAAIAPMPIFEHKRVKVDEIVKNLDNEFVKQVLFTPPVITQKQNAQVPVKAPEHLKLSEDQLALKAKMKSLLKTMLG